MNCAASMLMQGWLNPEDPGWLYFVPLWPLGIFAIWALWNMLRDSRDEKSMKRSLQWPEAQGRIISSKMVWGHVEIAYEYWVFAERFQGLYKINLRPVIPGGTAMDSLRAAKQLGVEGKENMAQYPAGTKVIVKYNREKKEESVLYCKGEVGPPDTEGPKVEAHFVTLE